MNVLSVPSGAALSHGIALPEGVLLLRILGGSLDNFNQELLAISIRRVFNIRKLGNTDPVTWPLFAPSIG